LESGDFVDWSFISCNVIKRTIILKHFVVMYTQVLLMVKTPTKKKPNPAEIEEARKWAVWEKEESTFEWYYDSEETFYVLEGEVTVTWDGGELSFGAGDLVTFPAGLKCTWHVKSKIRKHYTFG